MVGESGRLLSPSRNTLRVQSELFSVQTDESLDRGCMRCVDTTAGHHGQEKESQTHNARPVRLQCCRQSTFSTPRRCRRGAQYGHVPGRQAHEVVWMLRRVVQMINGDGVSVQARS